MNRPSVEVSGLCPPRFAGVRQAFAANFADVEDIVIPRIYWDLTTRQVLTMEFVEGVKITDTNAIRGLRKTGYGRSGSSFRAVAQSSPAPSRLHQ